MFISILFRENFQQTIVYNCPIVYLIVLLVQAIKYPVTLYKTAIQEGWEKPFALLFDLKATFQNSFIKDYTDYDSIQPLLSKKIARETYFKYIHHLNHIGWLKIKFNTITLPAYKTCGDSFRFVHRCSQHLARMRAQLIRRVCDKQAAKISTGVDHHDIKQVIEVGSAITFAVVNLQATIRLSCETLGKKFGKTKEGTCNSFGYRLKKQLSEMGLLIVKNSKDLLGIDKPLLYGTDRSIRLYKGVYIRQHADQIHAKIKYDEREKFISFKNLNVEERLKLIYCNDI